MTPATSKFNLCGLFEKSLNAAGLRDLRSDCCVRSLACQRSLNVEMETFTYNNKKEQSRAGAETLQARWRFAREQQRAVFLSPLT